MPGPQAGESGSMNIQQLQNVAMNVVETFCSIIAMPVEIILRPRYGTRYFPPPVVFFSAALMLFLPLFSSVATTVTGMIPFSHFTTPPGLFGIGSLAKLYFLLSFIHGIRIYRRMINPLLEDHSEYEGPPLPFFRLIPKGQSFWFTRIVLEPAFVFLAATLLANFYIVQPGLAAYLHFAALTLAMKQFIHWYEAWQFIRNILDARNAGPVIAKFVDNTATEDDLAQVHLASLPKNTPADLRQAAAAHIARLVSPGTTIPNIPEGDSNETH